MINLEKKNVAMTRCFFCGEANEILLSTKYNRKGEPVHPLNELDGKVINHNPCPKCAEMMQKGIMLIACRPAATKEEEKNPFRTGQMCVIKEDAFKRIFGTQLPAGRMVFIEVDAYTRLFGGQEETEESK